jgi:hypothetical protein
MTANCDRTGCNAQGGNACQGGNDCDDIETEPALKLRLRLPVRLFFLEELEP